MEEDLKVIFGYLKDFGSKRRFIIKVLGFFLILGLFVGIFSDKQFVATTSFTTRVSGDEKAGSGLKNIAALIGLNLGDNTESKDIPVYLYPKIIQNVTYRRALLETPIFIRGQKTSVTFKHYLTDIKRPDAVTIFKRFTVGLPGLIVNQFVKKSPPPIKIDSLNYVTKEEAILFSKMENILLFSIDQTDGSILLSVTLDENIAATQLVEKAKQLLQDKIIDYRIIKAQENLDFIERQYMAKKEEFENTQSNLAHYIDANLFNTTQTSQIRKQRLELQYNLNSVIYTELETQKVRQEIKVKEDTPVFVTLKPAIVPLKPVNDNLVIVIIKFLAIGFIVSVLLYVVKNIFRKISQIWKST